MIVTDILHSPLGDIVLTADGDMLCGLAFAERTRPLAAQQTGETPLIVSETRRWLSCFFAGRAPDFTPKLVPADTPFQNALREALLSIPYGETVTYAALAKTLHSSPRAVGHAIGRNPILLIVPCHRVIGKNGALTGYAGGLPRKAELLWLEQSARMK